MLCPIALGSAPLTPVTPMPGEMPPSPSAQSADKAKKSNPLTDLIETEKLYVEQLTGIIRVRLSFTVLHKSAVERSRPLFYEYTESRLGMVAVQPPAPRIGYHVPQYRGHLQS